MIDGPVDLRPRMPATTGSCAPNQQIGVAPRKAVEERMIGSARCAAEVGLGGLPRTSSDQQFSGRDEIKRLQASSPPLQPLKQRLQSEKYSLHDREERV